MKKLIIPILALITTGCATLTEDAMTPIAMSFSDGTSGKCKLQNKRGAWNPELPTTISIRKSDDGLKYDCETKDGRKAFGEIPSEMGAKIIASAIFLDFGIVDAITDKHRKYPVSFVIPIKKTDDESAGKEAVKEILAGSGTGSMSVTNKQINNLNPSDRVIEDTAQGVIWEAVPETKNMDFLDAERMCRKLRLHNMKNWRLPTVTELKNYINNIKTETENDYFWTTIEQSNGGCSGMESSSTPYLTVVAVNKEKNNKCMQTSTGSTHDNVFDYYKYRAICVNGY